MSMSSVTACRGLADANCGVSRGSPGGRGGGGVYQADFVYCAIEGNRRRSFVAARAQLETLKDERTRQSYCNSCNNCPHQAIMLMPDYLKANA